MAGKIIAFHPGTPTGNTVYALVLNEDVQPATTSTGLFAAYSAGSYANYLVTLTRLGGSNIYSGSMPANVTFGNRTAPVYEAIGGSGAQMDTFLGVGNIDWDGTGVITLYSLAQRTWDALTAALTTANSIGKWILDKLNVVVSTGITTVGAVGTGGITRATFAADTGLQSARSNTAQAGASTTITLDASASATNDFYKYSLIKLTGGTGAGQTRLCTGYVGSTKVATVFPAWATAPDNTSTFAVQNSGIADVEAYGAVAGTATSGVPWVNASQWGGTAVVDAIVSADIVKIDGNESAAERMAAGAMGNVIGVVGTGSTNTVIVTDSLDPDSVSTDQYKGKVVTFAADTITTGLRSQSGVILGNTTGGVITLESTSALTALPVADDSFTIC